MARYKNRDHWLFLNPTADCVSEDRFNLEKCGRQLRRHLQSPFVPETEIWVMGLNVQGQNPSQEMQI